MNAALVVTLLAVLIVTAPSATVPTTPLNKMLPVPAVRPSVCAPATVPASVLANVMLPIPAPVSTNIFPASVVAEL